jgi:hypothetical protein
MKLATRIGVSVVSLAGVVGLNVIQLCEAFGGGPPYYGRTTNMDKWSNPLPWLTALDLGAIAMVVALLVPILRRAAIEPGVAADGTSRQR